MKDKTVGRLAWCAAAASLVLAAAVYGILPERIPTHWDLDGTVTYSGKGMIWLLALLPLGLTALLRLVPRMDPRRKNYDRFRGFYDSFVLVMALFLLLINAVTVVEALRPGTLTVWRVVTMGVGLLLVFLGNGLPKVKSNFAFGVRTPWAISDPDVWNRTQRLGGRLLFLTGLVMAVCALALGEKFTFAVTVVGVVLIALVPAAMSYIWYRRRWDGTVDKRDPE